MKLSKPVFRVVTFRTVFLARRPSRLLVVGMAVLGMALPQVPFTVVAQDAAPAAAPAHPLLTVEELDALLAPIALYPDPLLAQILPAATVPHEIVTANRYLTSGKDPAQIDAQSWNESVKALARYPEVLKMMDEKLDWTTQLGKAYLDQPDDVFASVQHLRAEAAKVGNLKDSPQQVIVHEKEVIKIMPADPQVIYVPQYPPTTVYTTAPADPTTTLLAFGAGLAVGAWLSNDHNDYWYGRGSAYHGGGYHNGNYYGGNNTVNINNSTNVNVGNGNRSNNGNGAGNGQRPGNGNGQKPGNGNGAGQRPTTRPTTGATTQQRQGQAGAGQRSTTGASAQQRPASGASAQQRPASGASAQQRPAGGSAQQRPASGASAQQRPAGGSGFSREATKPQQQSGNGGRFGGGEGGNGGKFGGGGGARGGGAGAQRGGRGDGGGGRGGR